MSLAILLRSSGTSDNSEVTPGCSSAKKSISLCFARLAMSVAREPAKLSFLKCISVLLCKVERSELLRISSPCPWSDANTVRSCSSWLS